jgi:hypothetical protein
MYTTRGRTTRSKGISLPDTSNIIGLPGSVSEYCCMASHHPSRGRCHFFEVDYYAPPVRSSKLDVRRVERLLFRGRLQRVSEQPAAMSAVRSHRISLGETIGFALQSPVEEYRDVKDQSFVNVGLSLWMIVAFGFVWFLRMLHSSQRATRDLLRDASTTTSGSSVTRNQENDLFSTHDKYYAPSS